jgi:hypothetical protein
MPIPVRLLLAAGLLLTSPLTAPLAAQPTAATDLPPLLPEDREITLALSAGPSHVAQGAAVYALRRGGFVKLREGSNGYTCMVERDHHQSLAPICYDAEATATIVPAVLEIERLRESGLSYTEAMRRVDERFRAGTLQAPRRPALSYMLARKQVLYSSPTGERVGAWHPHLMIFSPGLTNAQIGSTGQDLRQPVVVNEGGPMAHLVIIVPEWSDGSSP